MTRRSANHMPHTCGENHEQTPHYQTAESQIQSENLKVASEKWHLTYKNKNYAASLSKIIEDKQ